MSKNINFHITTNFAKNAENNLICLHGFAENSDTWKNLTLLGQNIFAVDFLGHGKSPAPKELACYYFEDVISSLHAQIIATCKPPYNLLAYSMGGRLAIYYALKYQSEINCLILENASFGIKDELERKKRMEQDKILAENIINNGILWFEDYWSKQAIFASQAHLAPQIKQEIKSRRLECDKYGLANTLLGMGQTTLPYLGDLIPSLKLPILYLSGEYDTKYLNIGQEFAKLNKNLELCIIKDAGHNVHLEQAQIFQEKVQEFLNKNQKGHKK